MYNRYMGQCKCGHTRDAEKNCDGTHKVVKAVREEVAQDIENAVIETAGDSAATMSQAARIARGKKL